MMIMLMIDIMILLRVKAATAFSTS